MNVKPFKTHSIAFALVLAAAAGGQSAIAADMMPNTPENVQKAMDYNKDGMIDRAEYMRYHGQMFDHKMGKKGAVKPADIAKMMGLTELLFQGPSGG